jgi:hydrophobe/amphiphile efflux-1 (HAE1) family protein
LERSVNFNISAWAIKKPVPVILLFVVLTLVGLVSYFQLGVDDNPNIDFPIIVVTIGQPGASPTELETEVTRKVEDALVGISGLDHTFSTVTDGASTTVCEFVIGSSSETALNDVRDAVSRIRQQLPADISEPAITHPNFSGEPFIVYTISSDKRSVAELSELVDKEITRAILAVPGAADVSRQGGLDREIHVNLDPSRLRAVGTSTDYINGQLRQLNLNLPGGRADVGGQEQGIRTIASARSLEELRAFRIPLASGQSVRLDTLGTVEDTYAEVRQRAYLNGQPVVSFSVKRANGAPMVQTEEAVRAEVEKLQKSLPSDVKLTMIRTLADYVRTTFTASVDALLLGAALAVVVIYLFLRNWQTTIISALAIPLSIIATFWVMKTLGYTLNGITMLALTLVVGVLVDDAIVDLENIYRHITMGKDPFRAAIEATEEIGLAVVATTLTIVAVFVPVAFMGGIPGMFFRSFGITVAVAVLFSLLVARTLTPMMAAYILPKMAHPDKDAFYVRGYMKVLNAAMHHRWITMGVAVALLIGSFALVPLIPKGFFSQGDNGETAVSITLPAGSAIEDTDKVALAVTKLMQSQPEVKTVLTTIGNATTGAGGGLVSTGGSVTNAAVTIILVPKHDRHVSVNQFQDRLRPELAKIPGARVAFNQYGATGAAKPVSIILRGTDPVELERVSDKLLGEMRRLPELRDVTSTAAELRPEIHIRPNLARAAEQGVSVATIGRMARIATQGDADFNLPKFNALDEQINIRVKLPDTARMDMQDIGNLLVPGKGGMVPLRSVADIELGGGPVQIDRYDRMRRVTFSANLGEGANLGAATEKIDALPTMKNLPASISKGSVGEVKIMMDIFTGFAFALGTAVLLIYVVLVLLFGGFLHPFTIMLALPLSIGGALLGLLAGNKELGMMALIGIVMLMGLVTKNSILLVEYALKAIHDGMGREEAIKHAGRDRVRPILMTTVAMIAGMLPIALSIGEGTEELSPMAVAVIGGLITSTLLTLVVVPAAFTIVDDFRNWGIGLFRRKKKAGPEPEPVPVSIESTH